MITRFCNETKQLIFQLTVLNSYIPVCCFTSCTVDQTVECMKNTDKHISPAAARFDLAMWSMVYFFVDNISRDDINGTYDY